MGTIRWGLLLALSAAVSSTCGVRELDAGSNRPPGLLPVDERNPIVVCNDGAFDGWQGEFAIALAAASKLRLLGIVVNTSNAFPSLQTNLQGWVAMADAARSSGMGPIPAPVGSLAPPLKRPASGDIDATTPNGSDGARLIVDAARRFSRPSQPIVVATGGVLTDVADAYLLDHAVVDRVVVVARLGTPLMDEQVAELGNPNAGDMWANEIVARRLRYVQTYSYYSQEGDLTTDLVATFPPTAFASWIASKLPLIVPTAADQISVFAAALRTFSLRVTRMSETSPAPLPDGDKPTLGVDPTGTAWVVNAADPSVGVSLIRQILLNPATYNH